MSKARKAARPVKMSEIRAWALDHGAEKAFLADGFEQAFLGFTDGSWDRPAVAVYSRQRMIKVLMSRDKMELEEAFSSMSGVPMWAKGRPSSSRSSPHDTI